MPIETWAVISRDGEAGWCGRRKHQVVSHRGSLYLMGGYTSAGVIGAGIGPDANLNDVWKSTEGAVSLVFSLLMVWVEFLASHSYMACGVVVFSRGWPRNEKHWAHLFLLSPLSCLSLFIFRFPQHPFLRMNAHTAARVLLWAGDVVGLSATAAVVPDSRRRPFSPACWCYAPLPSLLL